MSPLKVSLVLCTHNPREPYLRRTLDGLRAQTLPLTQWELLLIDNASTEPLASRFDLAWHPNDRHLREDELGLTPARLRGIAEAQSDILVFADDDTVFDPDYLEQALAVAHEWPFIGVWGGSVSPEFETPPPAWSVDHFWRLTIVEVKEDIWSNLREGFVTMPCGAGMCIRKSVAERFVEWCRLNRTSHNLGRKGTALSGYEDNDLAHCAMDIGLGMGKSTRLHLTHLIPASRLTLDYFIRHAEGDGASLLMFRAIRGLPVAEPKRSWPVRLKRQIYRHISSKPKEFFLIEDAHIRGIEKGWQLVQEYRASQGANAK